MISIWMVDANNHYKPKYIGKFKAGIVDNRGIIIVEGDTINLSARLGRNILPNEEFIVYDKNVSSLGIVYLNCQGYEIVQVER